MITLRHKARQITLKCEVHAGVFFVGIMNIIKNTRHAIVMTKTFHCYVQRERLEQLRKAKFVSSNFE